MSIQSRGEFEVVIADIMLTLERASYERPDFAPLLQARRDLKLGSDAVKSGVVTKLIFDKFSKATEVANSVGRDPVMEDHLFDLVDYIEALVPKP